MSLVVYTAVFGPEARQELRPIRPIPGVEYFAFSEKVDWSCEGWSCCSSRCPEPAGCPSDRWTANRSRYLARWHKVMSCLLFPTAPATLWLDARVELRADPRMLVNRFLGLANGRLLAHQHPERDCCYDEAEQCSRFKLDDPAVIKQQMQSYREAGDPEHSGLWETGVLLRAVTPETAEFERLWWAEVAAGSFRDQLSFGHAARASRLPICSFSATIRKSPWFRLRPHKRRSPAVY